MSTITKSAYAAYDSETERDDRIIAIKVSEGCSLSAAGKIVTAIAKERGDTVNRRGITDSMYDFLTAEKRSAEDLEKWIGENGTANTMRWIKSHDKVRVLVNTLMDKHEATLKTIAEPGPMPEKPKAEKPARTSTRRGKNAAAA